MMLLKIRVWDTDKKRMIYADKICRINISNGQVDGIVLLEDNKILLNFILSYATGQTDADGTERYSGDIIEYHSLELNPSDMVPPNTCAIRRQVVEWSKTRSRFEGCYSHGRVIGNIYANPGLYTNSRCQWLKCKEARIELGMAELSDNRIKTLMQDNRVFFQ